MWIEELSNGKYRCVERYEDFVTGKTKKVSVTIDKNTAQARKAAQKTLQARIETALENVYEKKEDITLEKLVELYREDQQKTVKESTYTRNYFACETLKRLLGSDTLANRLTANYVYTKFRDSGKEPGTLNEHLSRFRALIRWGYRHEYINDVMYLNKLENFKDTPHKVKIQDKYLEKKELKQLLNRMNMIKWRLLTEFFALSGLRFGEAAALLQSDIDYNERVIHVTKNYDMINDVVTSTKTTCSCRDVYIQDELFSTCKKMDSYRKQEVLMYGFAPSDLFTSDKSGGFIHYFSYNKYLSENAAFITDKHITAHALRHTHASLLMESGVDIETISRRLGHENSKITREVYIHVTEQLEKKDSAQIKQISLLA